MSNHADPREPDEAMFDAAAAWSVRLNEADPDIVGFEAWLGADPRHAKAFEHAKAVFGVFDGPDVERTIAPLRAGVEARAHKTRRGAVVMFALGATAIAAGIGALGFALWPLLDGVNTFTTGAGERRFVTLSDGSRLALDAETQVIARYSGKARTLTLARGQARFDVAHDVSRPFTVTAEDRTVLATGTAFNIDIFGPKLLVTMLEGRAKVSPLAPDTASPSAKTDEPIDLVVGQQLISEPGQGVHVGAADLSEITAWQSGKIFFAGAALPDAVARVNRYSKQQIVVADAKLNAMQINGAFDVGDSNSFVEAVTALLPVDAQRTSVSVVALVPRD